MKCLRLFFWWPLLAVSLLVWAADPIQAQGDLENIQSTLERSMARQAPLANEDIQTYLRYADPIYRLRFEPDRQDEVIRDINYWDESRFAYVTTKMAVGMSLLLRPNDPRNASIPNFARPTRVELDLIRRHQDELARIMDSMQAKYAPNGSS